MDSRLYLLNDDIHTFEEVIYILRKYFGYPILQGASIADIVHQKGKCQIKTGPLEELELYKEGLIKDGFNVKIEKDYEGY
jgi:ATP-dependent Clp protease adaptor protein ClpS